ncbi:helix-turn-helix domain-containing protein [Bradyrhizobium elkanii]
MRLGARIHDLRDKGWDIRRSRPRSSRTRIPFTS